MSTVELAPVVVGLAVGIALIVMFSVMLPSGFSTPDDDSKSSGKVVFSGAVNRNVTHQIYVVDSDGTDLTNLTNEDVLWHFEPVSAPDGTKIAYVSWNSFPNAPANGKLTQDLYVVNADGAKIVCYDELSSFINLGEDKSYIIRVFAYEDPFHIVGQSEADSETEIFVPHESGDELMGAVFVEEESEADTSIEITYNDG